MDVGSLAHALAQLAGEVRDDSPHGGLLVTVDEMQVASAADLALVAATLHRLNVDHPAAVVLFAGTGLPFTAEALRKAGVTHPDRLFVLHDIPLTLDVDDARYAVIEPARAAGVSWEPEAADRLVDLTNGYPAHLQLFADAAWTAAPGPHTITLHDVQSSLPTVGAQLEQRTLGPGGIASPTARWSSWPPSPCTEDAPPSPPSPPPWHENKARCRGCGRS